MKWSPDERFYKSLQNAVEWIGAALIGSIVIRSSRIFDNPFLVTLFVLIAILLGTTLNYIIEGLYEPGKDDE